MRRQSRDVVYTKAKQADGSHVFTLKKRHGEFEAAVAEREHLLGEHRQLAGLWVELVLHRLSCT